MNIPKALVTTFKKKHKGKKQEEQATQLQEQIVLLQSLCEKITKKVELPAQAIAGLGDWGICCFGLGGLLAISNYSF